MCEGCSFLLLLSWCEGCEEGDAVGDVLTTVLCCLSAINCGALLASRSDYLLVVYLGGRLEGCWQHALETHSSVDVASILLGCEQSCCGGQAMYVILRLSS